MQALNKPQQQLVVLGPHQLPHHTQYQWQEPRFCSLTRACLSCSKRTELLKHSLLSAKTICTHKLHPLPVNHWFRPINPLVSKWEANKLGVKIKISTILRRKTLSLSGWFDYDEVEEEKQEIRVALASCCLLERQEVTWSGRCISALYDVTKCWFPAHS